jgi:hypothetical protein
LSFEMSAFIITWVAILLLAFALSGLVRQVHAINSVRTVSLRTGPPIGALVPELDGALKARHPAMPTVLLFSEAGCSICDELLPEVARLARLHDGSIRFGVVFRGRGMTTDSAIVESFEDQAEAFERFGISAVPYGVVISPDGVIVDSQPTGSVALLQRVVSGAVRTRAKE